MASKTGNPKRNLTGKLHIPRVSNSLAGSLFLLLITQTYASTISPVFGAKGSVREQPSGPGLPKQELIEWIQILWRWNQTSAPKNSVQMVGKGNTSKTSGLCDFLLLTAMWDFIAKCFVVDQSMLVLAGSWPSSESNRKPVTERSLSRTICNG